MKNIKVLILAWWSWTRLWPLSRKYYPKQFLKIKEFWDNSFFEKAFDRALKITSKENIFIITNSNYKFHSLNQSSINESQIIIESEAKNTLWAIALWIESWNDDDVFLVLSSDHLIGDEELFAKNVLLYTKQAQESILIFGIKPNSPNTWYGYINFEKNSLPPHKVLEFKEKPNLETAKTYIKNWYMWNAWIFMFSKKVFFDELKAHNKDYYDIIKTWVWSNFSKLPDLSIDYWLLEKTNNIKIVPLDIYWNDLGSFDAFKEYFIENNISYDKTQIDASWNTAIVESREKEVAFIWVDDLIVVDTKDALLISKSGQTQKVKEVLEYLKSKNKTHTDFWMTVYRPWWSYTIVDEWIWFKSKRLTVIPGKKLSSQMHHHRSEHWVVVSGTAKVTLNDKEFLLQKWESTYIPIWTKHRLENPWKTTLHIIESQIGDYLEEDDIVRYDDDFWRA